MKKNRKDLKKACLLSIIIALFLLTIMGSSYNLSVYALKRYGYEKGDEYRFVMEMSTTTDTEEGKATASQSYEMIIKITDVEEDVGSYSIKIDYLLVGSTVAGFYGDSLMTEGSMEGDGLITGGSFLTGEMFNLFTSTDWSDREDEWDDYVDGIDDQTGYKVTEDSASNGVFTLQSEMDVSDDDSFIDYDDDGDYDDYTGRLSVRGEYDSNGVLTSSTAEYYIEFNSENSVTYSSNVYRGGPSPASSDMLIYVAIGVASFVVAFILGFFVGKRIPKATEISAT